MGIPTVAETEKLIPTAIGFVLITDIIVDNSHNATILVESDERKQEGNDRLD